MQTTLATIAFFVAAANAAATGEASSTNPLQKTMDMLQDLIGKIEKEQTAAAKEYEDFTKWCTKSSRNLKYEIKTGKAEIVGLQAEIEKQTSEAAASDSKIMDLSGSISQAEGQLKEATGVREKEAADKASEIAELKETIDMLQRAIVIIEREMAKGDSSELQLGRSRSLTEVFGALVQASAFSAADATRLTSFVQSANSDSLDASDSEAELGAPEVAAYESHSGTIVDTLEDLLDKAKQQLEDAMKAEMTSRHNFEMLQQSLTDSIKYSTEDMESAKKAKQESAEAKAAAEGDLDHATKELKEDETGLADVEGDCMTRAKDFEEETKDRKEEVAALTKALEILTESSTGAAAVTYGEEAAAFVQLKRSSSRVAARSRVQIRSTEASSTGTSSFKAMRFVRHLAQHNGSHQLVLLARRLDSLVQAASTSGQDPFAKVRGLIEDLIERLEKDAAADAKKKAFCDKEMAEAKAKKEDKTEEVEKLTTKIDSKTAEAAKLREEVATIQKEISDLIAEQAEADKLRQEENAQYLKDKPELEAGIEGVKLALKVLREYYSASEETDSKGTSTGIIGMLEVVESDFTKGLAELETAEEAAAQSYDKEKKENEVLKATKDQDVKYKTKAATALDKAVAELTSDRATVQEELDAILEALAKLEDMCIAKPEPYAERVERRAREISGLKEALEILESETATSFVQQQSRRQLRGVQRHQQVPTFDKGAVEEDWGNEWRQGDYPSREEIAESAESARKAREASAEEGTTDDEPKLPMEGGKPVFDKSGFEADWHDEWRQGDFPSYKDTYRNGEAAAAYEDSQSDGKPSPASSGLP